MQLNHYGPWALLNGLRRDVDRRLRTEPGTGAWTPAVDVTEAHDHYLVAADVPGVKREDVEITLADRVLTIQGERRFGDAAQHEDLRRIERVRGPFYRRLRLPESAADDGIQASYSEGVLTIRIPKEARAQARRIEVSTH